MTACNACSTRYSRRGGTATSTISCTTACAQNGTMMRAAKVSACTIRMASAEGGGCSGFCIQPQAQGQCHRDSVRVTTGVSVSAACTCAESMRCAVQSSTHDPDEALWETEGAAENM